MMLGSVKVRESVGIWFESSLWWERLWEWKPCLRAWKCTRACSMSHSFSRYIVSEKLPKYGCGMCHGSIKSNNLRVFLEAEDIVLSLNFNLGKLRNCECKSVARNAHSNTEQKVLPGLGALLNMFSSKEYGNRTKSCFSSNLRMDWFRKASIDRLISWFENRGLISLFQNLLPACQ